MHSILSRFWSKLCVCFVCRSSSWWTWS